VADDEVTAGLDRLAALAGPWAGTGKLWFEPGTEPAEHPTDAELRVVAGGTAAVLTYRWRFEGEAQAGALLVTVGDGGWQAAWTDSFHHARSLMVLTGATGSTAGAPPPEGDVVLDALGSYEVGDGPPWGWRTTLSTTGPASLLLTSWNVAPDGGHHLAVLDTYHRS
jgi:hypothetical protein